MDNKKLRDTKGGYAQFLRENVGEAKVMEEKEKRVKVLEQSTVKAKSKVRPAQLCVLYIFSKNSFKMDLNQGPDG